MLAREPAFEFYSFALGIQQLSMKSHRAPGGGGAGAGMAFAGSYVMPLCSSFQTPTPLPQCMLIIST